MDTGEVITLAGFSAAAVMVVQFFRNMLGTNILNGARTQALAVLVSIGFGFLAAESAQEFEASRDDIIGTIVLIFLLGQSIYNLGFRNSAIESKFDDVMSRITGRRIS